MHRLIGTLAGGDPASELGHGLRDLGWLEIIRTDFAHCHRTGGLTVPDQKDGDGADAEHEYD